MFEVGRVCVKLAGRDAMLKCVVVEVIDKNMVLIDGETRRRKCNIDHLEPLEQKIDIKKGASHEEVKKAFEKMGLAARDTKPKTASEKPVSQRKGSDKPKEAEVVKPAKKPAKTVKMAKTEAKEVAAEEKEAKPVKKAPVKKAKKEE